MSRYIVTVARNRVVDVEERDDEDEEPLGIEWALSEMKDNYRHARNVDASYSLADHAELDEFLSHVERLLGPEATAEWRAKRGKT